VVQRHFRSRLITIAFGWESLTVLGVMLSEPRASFDEGVNGYNCHKT